MVYHLLLPFSESVAGLGVIQYLTFRTAAASLTAFTISLALGPWLIARLRAFQIGQVIRQDGPTTHKAKAGTPTMGGILVLAAVFGPTLLWADLSNAYIWIAVVSAASFGAIGFADDYLKITRRSHHGLFARYKFLAQVLVATGVGVAAVWLAGLDDPMYDTHLVVPFFKAFSPDLGWLYVPFVTFVLVAMSNTVNLTDGLDGLAISTFAVSAGTYTALAYLIGHAVFSQYLLLPFELAAGELTIFCGALVGASLGFLWWNAHPADIFMGDVGSLALGGALGTVAVLIKQELLLPIVCGVYVLEGLSVILQVGWFKLTGRRIFRMAPLHHHFELLGWQESKVVMRFQILAIVFALFSLTTLKLR